MCEISRYNIFLGRKYDKHGNSVQWWTLQTIDKYDQIAQCFIDQYNDYQVPDLDPPVQVSITI